MSDREKQTKLVKSLIKKAFAEYDIDGSSYLERNELRKFVDDSCKEVGLQQVSEVQLDKILHSIDHDKDGKVSLAEFSELLKPMIEQQLGVHK